MLPAVTNYVALPFHFCAQIKKKSTLSGQNVLSGIYSGCYLWRPICLPLCRMVQIQHWNITLIWC